MERTEVLDMMSSLKLYGMRSAYDETLATAIKRKHEPQRFVGNLLNAEISEKQTVPVRRFGADADGKGEDPPHFRGALGCTTRSSQNTGTAPPVRFPQKGVPQPELGTINRVTK
jgi:hypothetical protein